jgi:integrase
MAILKEQRKIQVEWRLKAGEAWEKSNLVFTDELGHHLAGGTIYKNFKKIMLEIGLPEVSLHDLRHTFAVNSLRSGDDPKTVSENLGHHCAGFTLDRYAHVTEQMRTESARRMENFISGLKARK